MVTGSQSKSAEYRQKAQRAVSTKPLRSRTPASYTSRSNKEEHQKLPESGRMQRPAGSQNLWTRCQVQMKLLGSFSFTLWLRMAPRIPFFRYCKRASGWKEKVLDVHHSVTAVWRKLFGFLCVHVCAHMRERLRGREKLKELQNLGM